MPADASFSRISATIGGAEVVARVGGSGPGLLLLHGFPQTHRAWRHVAPALAQTHTVICPDLPGYGESAPPAARDPYAKRTTARTVLELARHLGHDTVAVAGPHRGALVALRAALDHPDAVTHLAVLDVVPTIDMWDALRGTAGVFAFHLYLLAHPAPLPEAMVGADPDGFFAHFLDSWTRVPGAIPDDVREHYLAACRDPRVVHAICEDYRAGATVDVEHDRVDRHAGRTVAAPTLALWQDPDGATLPFDPLQVWRRWTRTLTAGVVAAGHFLPEEAPDVVTDHLRRLLAPAP